MASSMDVLRPNLKWVGNRCYRTTICRTDGTNPEDEDIYDEGEKRAPVGDYCDESCDTDLDIEETSRGCRYVMNIPSPFYKYLIGKKGETKRRIESESRTQIVIPKQGDPVEEVVIKGHDRKGIVSAKTRIDLLVDSARQKEQFTHFLSVPVHSEEVHASFDGFKFDVLNQCDGDRGLDASLFQTREKLHLTIGTLVLLNDSEIQSACELLKRCNDLVLRPILQGGKLDVRIQGLEYMNDDPASVDVLYAKVLQDDACERLQMVCDRLVDQFTTAGLMQRQHDRVKLHATVMNSLMRKDPSGTHDPRQTTLGGGFKNRESFDASSILKIFKNYDFGPLPVPSIHLSQRYSTDSNGYYKPASVLQI